LDNAKDVLRFLAHRQEARMLFETQGILSALQFHFDDLRNVGSALRECPKMFQIFACKQVFGISGVYYYLHKLHEPGISSPLCPFCTLHHKMTGHVLACPKEGRVKMHLKLSETCPIGSWQKVLLEI
jgi:hypothetical protein